MNRLCVIFVLMLGCDPGTTIHLGSWPGRADDEDDAPDAGAERDGGESDAGSDSEDEERAEVSDPEQSEPCTSEAACARSEHQTHCHAELGYCVECLVDAHCELDKRCASNRCRDL